MSDMKKLMLDPWELRLPTRAKIESMALDELPCHCCYCVDHVRRWPDSELSIIQHTKPVAVWDVVISPLSAFKEGGTVVLVWNGDDFTVSNLTDAPRWYEE